MVLVIKFLKIIIIYLLLAKPLYAEVQIVQDDLGGPMDLRYNEYMEYDGYFEIRGKCYSACGMRLWDPVRQRLRACARNDDDFGFHGIYSGGLWDDERMKIYAQFLPPSMRSWWWKNATPLWMNKLVHLSGAEMIARGWVLRCT